MSEQDRRPIGYWLKHVDRLIEESLERTLGAEGLEAVLTGHHLVALRLQRGDTASPLQSSDD